jgi:hypothetical protein
MHEPTIEDIVFMLQRDGLGRYWEKDLIAVLYGGQMNE